ncbi:STAS domain-containing protein [Oceanobacillus rekensis]|uniref:STAS domain-containing protein n=1 Tax=Oceanobacillus rekensis TaxID=937927 RepID=UPI000B44FA3C|nr:STAS domain-containing protein [Oceanobacillus rekensis]
MSIFFKLNKCNRRKIKRRKGIFVRKVATEYRNSENVNDYINEYLELTIEALEEKKYTGDHAASFGEKIGQIWIEAKGLDSGISQIYEVRRIFWNGLKAIMLEQAVLLETSLTVVDIFDSINNKIIQSYSTASIASIQESLNRKEEEFLSHSAPIVPIMGGIAILPIIGGIDEKRAERLMRKSLYEVSKRELDYLLIDLSGILIIDTLIAYHIFKIVDSLELIGVKTVLVGIRPEVSHTMVSLGIDFSKVKTYSNLQQAFSTYIIKK